MVHVKISITVVGWPGGSLVEDGQYQPTTFNSAKWIGVRLYEACVHIDIYLFYAYTRFTQRGSISPNRSCPRSLVEFPRTSLMQSQVLRRRLGCLDPSPSYLISRLCARSIEIRAGERIQQVDQPGAQGSNPSRPRPDRIPFGLCIIVRKLSTLILVGCHSRPTLVKPKPFGAASR